MSPSLPERNKGLGRAEPALPRARGELVLDMLENTELLIYETY